MGILKKLCPATANVDHLLYVVPEGKRATVMLNISNRDKNTATVALAVMDTADVSLGSCAVVTKGQGFSAIPTVAIEGDCSTAAEIGVDTMSLASAVINNAGEKHAVNDVLTLAVTGGVGTTVAKLKVTAVSETGGITAFVIDTDGVYTTLGTVATVTSTTGIGTGATFASLTWGINTASVKKPGNGYKTNPKVTIPGGTGAAISTQMVRIVENDDYFEPETPINKSQPLERTGIPLSAGQSLYIRPSVAGLINAHVFGIEALA